MPVSSGHYLERGEPEAQRGAARALPEVGLSNLHISRGHPCGVVLFPPQNRAVALPGHATGLPTAGPVHKGEHCRVLANPLTPN